MRYVFAITLATCMMFGWQTLSRHLFPVFSDTIQDLPEEGQFGDLWNKIGKTGVYRFPGTASMDPQLSSSRKNWINKASAGPYGFLFIRKDGANPLDIGVYVRALLLDFLLVLLATWMLNQARLAQIRQRFLFITGLGVVVAVSVPLVQLNWMALPRGFSAIQAFDNMCMWACAALPLALLLRPNLSTTNPPASVMT